MAASQGVILLIGGLAMRGDDFSPLTDALRRRGVRGLTFDNPGAGDGPRISPLSISALAVHALAEAARLTGGTTPVTVFGLGMGGMIAAMMTTLAPARVRRLALGATSGNSADFPAVPDSLYRTWRAAETPDAVRASVLPAFGAATVASRPGLVEDHVQYRLRRGNKQSPQDFRDQLDAIREFPGKEVYDALSRLPVSVTVISGDEDRVFPAPHGTWLARHAEAHVVLPRTGHMLHLENPDGLAEVLAPMATRL
jgi:pimeloyl-ACP methyl ester carboxylesterase